MPKAKIKMNDLEKLSRDKAHFISFVQKEFSIQHFSQTMDYIYETI